MVSFENLRIVSLYFPTTNENGDHKGDDDDDDNKKYTNESDTLHRD